jgi:hypothetical protein
MTPTRATTAVGLASVLVAWLAGAAGLSVTSSSHQPQVQRSETSATQALADDIQAQASRLRSRLATAPAPRQPLRNPFTFATRVVRPAQGLTTVAPKPLVTAPPGEPPLQLVGVAERETSAGTIRTAMITSDSDELFMLLEGETLGARYRVKTVAAESVELTDLVTGTTRRLALR